MRTHGSSSGPDECEITDATAAATGRRRHRPTVGRPGTRARQRYGAAADGPAAPDTALPGNGPVRARTTAAERTNHRHVDLGPVRMSLLSPPSPPDVVELEGRYADGLPLIWHLIFATHGPLVLTHDQRALRLEPGSVVLQEPSGLFQLSAAAAAPSVRALILHVPEAALALSGKALHEMSGCPASTRSGPAALLASFVSGLATHAPSAEARHTAWLGTAAVNLATAFLDGETTLPHGGNRPRPARAVPAEHRSAPSGTDLLLRDIKAYVERHLRDPDLSPASIAAAGHISLRYLHHLFQRDGLSVGAFLRERRLEHCRADLSDPAQSQRRVCEIARRWGFRDPAVFSRTFKSAYGVAPGAYRRQRLQR